MTRTSRPPAPVATSPVTLSVPNPTLAGLMIDWAKEWLIDVDYYTDPLRPTPVILVFQSEQQRSDCLKLARQKLDALKSFKPYARGLHDAFAEVKS